MDKEQPNSSRACVYCGEPATTRDHIPPRSIFAGLHLPNLITVPACQECNNRASGFDERFRNMIGMRASEESPNSFAIWEKTFRALKRNRSQLEALWESLEQVPIFSDSGLYIGLATAAAFDAEAHDRTIERITRGLYFHHLGFPLRSDLPVTAMLIQDGANWQIGIASLLMRMRVSDVGGPAAFEYVFARAEDDIEASLWIYRFGGCHLAAAVTGSLAANENT